MRQVYQADRPAEGGTAVAMLCSGIHSIHGIYTMATCPLCKGHLTENHRCPRSRARIVVETVLAAAAGGVCTLLLVSLADPHGQTAMDGVALVGGALAGVGIDRLFRA